MPVSILLAEDHLILRQTLRMALDNGDGFRVVGEASDGREAVKLSRKLLPNVVLMDISLPALNGVEACRQIVEECESTKVLALSVNSDKRYVERMLEAGAAGYLVKDCSMDELKDAIEIVAQGKTYLSPDIATLVVSSLLSREEHANGSPIKQLSPREREVLQLIAEGNTTKGIASLLNLSDKTIETHRRQIMIKLNLRSIAELTKFAVREGLTSLDT